MLFGDEILGWYYSHKRDLPWRNTKNPYHIWLSEIILQQTRVQQGLPYYYKFVENYPKVENLASSSEEEVLKLWQGLGYYSRGRNLHSSAKYIMNELKGVFPSNFKDIMKLKGVGEYTAAAIASFAFNEKVAVIDGNVIRVLTRYFGIEDDILLSSTQKQIKQVANDMLPLEKHADYNQGIMEFGALQCIPASPNCKICPLSDTCFANKETKVKKIPYKSKRIKVRQRFLNYIVFKHSNYIIFNKREEKDIWKGLYDFPLIESDDKLLNFNEINLNDMLDIIKVLNMNDYRVSVSEDFVHVLSHQKLHVRFFLIELNEEFEKINKPYVVADIENETTFGKPILIQNYLNKYIL